MLCPVLVPVEQGTLIKGCAISALLAEQLRITVWCFLHGIEGDQLLLKSAHECFIAMSQGWLPEETTCLEAASHFGECASSPKRSAIVKAVLSMLGL